MGWRSRQEPNNVFDDEVEKQRRRWRTEGIHEHMFTRTHPDATDKSNALLMHCVICGENEDSARIP